MANYIDEYESVHTAAFGFFYLVKVLLLNQQRTPGWAGRHTSLFMYSIYPRYTSEKGDTK